MRPNLKPFFIYFLVTITGVANAQTLLDRVTSGKSLPDNLLSTRSAVFYTVGFSEKDLKTIQESFQKTGIDAVIYFDADLVDAGRDPEWSLAVYLARRNIVNMIFFNRNDKTYSCTVTPFNKRDNFVDDKQSAYRENDTSLAELLSKMYRASSSLKKENLLINDFPETDLHIDPISGRRSEFFALDLKVDQLAIPKTGDPEKDRVLEEMFSSWPYKYKLTEPGILEPDLRKQGYLYVLRFVHARGSIARELLGYPVASSETALASVTYPNGLPQVKNISAEVPVYKFYFKHIDSGNVFLGTKWDADITWEQALKNHIMAFKSELKIN